MKIKKIVLSFFKGFKDKVVELADNCCISADNGVGKTTLATAFYWILCDRDYDLQGNPRVRHEVEGVPLDDVDVSAELIVDIDGTEHSIKKIQKCRKSKPDANGIVKTATTNSYEVNAVPLNERDFTAKLLEIGIDLNKVLECTHPDVFMSGKLADRRNKLFALAGSHSDLELAQQGEDTALLAEELKKYKLNEIEAMNKATLKKCNEDLKSIPAKIEGMEASKIDIDVAEQELYKNQLLRALRDIEDREADNSKIFKEYSDLQTEIFKLDGFERNDIIRRANEGLFKQQRELQSEISEIERELEECQRSSMLAFTSASGLKNGNELLQRRKAELVTKYREEQAKQFDESVWVFDENSLVCPMCGQPLPTDKQATRREDFDKRKEAARASFEDSKRKELERITAQGLEAKAKIEETDKQIAEKEALITEHQKLRNDLEQKLTAKKSELAALPESVDLTDNAELKALEVIISEFKDQLNKMSNGEELKAQLKAQRTETQELLDGVNKQIAQSENNARIDDNIVTLKEQRKDYEQKKADAENILHQIKMLSKRKNETLESEVNSHFNIIKWKLFDYQANGEIVDCCIPMIDGHDYDYAANGARKIIARLDICNAFQQFYNIKLPVWLDDASEITLHNLPKFDFQLIQLRVSEDKELKVEKGECL